MKGQSGVTWGMRTSVFVAPLTSLLKPGVLTFSTLNCYQRQGWVQLVSRPAARTVSSIRSSHFSIERVQGLKLSIWTLTTLGPARRVPTAVKSS